MPKLFHRMLAALGKQCVSLSLSRKMRWAERYVPEVMLAGGSLWAAYALYHPPSNFAAFPQAFAFVDHLQSEEHFWATVALIGAMAKILGLTWQALTSSRRNWSALAVRCFGLAISMGFWFLMTAGTIWGNPDTLFGGLGIIMILTASWVLLRTPAMPGDTLEDR